MGAWDLFVVVSSQRTSARRRSVASAASLRYRQDSARGDQASTGAQAGAPECLRAHHSQSPLDVGKRAQAPAAGDRRRIDAREGRCPSPGLACRRKVASALFHCLGLAYWYRLLALTFRLLWGPAE